MASIRKCRLPTGSAGPVGPTGTYPGATGGFGPPGFAGSTVAPAPGFGNVQLVVYTQGAEPFWCTLPEVVDEDKVNAAKVGARLRGVSKGRVAKMGIKLVDFTLDDKGAEFLVHRLDVCVRAEDGTCTPEMMDQWRADIQGVVFDIWVKDTKAGSIHYWYPDSTVHFPSVRWRWWAHVWNQCVDSVAWLFDKLFLERRWLRWLRRKEIPSRNGDSRTLALPVHITEGDEVVIRGRFPMGWKASRVWRLGFVIMGIDKETAS
jgi:hypothetical protein